MGTFRRAILLGALSFLTACGSCGEDGANNGPGTDGSNNGGLTCGELDCSANASCNDDGGARCVCKPGYEGDGRTCSEITTACESDDDCGNGTCSDGECECDMGYAPDGSTCADADECATGTDDCDERATCSNTEGSFVCTCGAGWMGDGFTCLDLDECAAGTYDCDGENSACVNTEGGYECGCADGFTLVGDSCATLVDCNAMPDACDDNATCTDTPDGSACACDDGWRGDGTTCFETGFADVSVSADGACGRRNDGSVWCWGYGVPAGEASGLIVRGIRDRPVRENSNSTWREFVGGSNRWCGIETDGTLHCVGAGRQDSKVGTDSDWKQVAPHKGYAFDIYTCALKEDGTRWCWGVNDQGQFGNGTTGGSEDPIQVDMEAWTQIEQSQEFGCGVRADSTLWCWGSGNDGQFGDPSIYEALDPVQLGTATNWERVSVGNRGACAINSGGELWCWGGLLDEEFRREEGLWKDYELDGLSFRECGVRTDGTLWCSGQNLWGERGDEDFQNGALAMGSQVGTDTDWEQVGVGPGHTCARKTSGDTYCFGHNALGQLGIGGHGFHTTPQAVDPGTAFTAVAAGQAHTCAITVGGQLRCTGSNIAGHLGLGQNVLHVQNFTRVGMNSDWKNVTAGIQHTCATRGNGGLFCAGFGGGGQTGLGEGAQIAVEMQRVGQASNWADVDAAPTWTCGITTTGQISCWGINKAGQLGDGGVETAYTPQQIGTNLWKEITTSGFVVEEGHTCAIASDDSLYCWGKNDLGQVGDGSMANSMAPVQVDTGQWTQIDAGAAHTCGVKADGTLWCWGANANGRLGLGQNNLQGTTMPTQVGSATDWARVSAGYLNTCAVKTSGTLWCWGDATAGLVGLGEVQPGFVAEPTRVGTANNWQYVETDYFATCAIKRDGGLFCWGFNRDGQLGLGNAWYHVPQLVE